MVCKHNVCTALDRLRTFQEDEAPRFQDSQHFNVVRLSALRTGRLHNARNILGTHFFRLSRSQGHSAVGRNMSTTLTPSGFEPATFRYGL